MNESLATTMDHSDSRFFSQRAKHISLLNEQTASVLVKSQPPPVSEVRFQFSNRAYVSTVETESTAVGRGHGCSMSNDHPQSISVGRGRTTVPLSAFVLQKGNISPSSATNTNSTPIFVMHDEVQFVRPYFGPRQNNDTQTLSSMVHKRDVLLSALKEIESDLQAL